MGELSEPFKIITGARQGDVFHHYCSTYYWTKSSWEKELKTQGLYKPSRLGRKTQRLDICCLACADDLAIFTDNTETAVKQIGVLKEMAEKVGLQISFGITEYISNEKDAPEKITTKYGQIKRIYKFKYLGEIIQANGIEKEAHEQRNQKMTRAFWKTGNIYNKACLSRNTKK